VEIKMRGDHRVRSSNYLHSALSQLQQSDPTKYQQVTQQIATTLRSAAQSAQAGGNSTAANQLSQLATDFTNVSHSGQLPSLAQAVGDHHDRHHSPSTDSDGSSSDRSSFSSISSSSTSQRRHHQAGRLVEAGNPFPDNPDGRARHADRVYLLGMIAYEGGRYDIAVELFGQAIQLRKDNPCYHYDLGNVFKALGRIDDAVAQYRRALDLEPDYVEAHNNLGIILNEQGRIHDAVVHYERALVLKPDCVEAHNNLGVALVAQGRIVDAQAHYEYALVLKPDYADAHNNLGIILNEQGRIDDAAAHYERALFLKPDNAYAHNNLGNIFKARGEFEDATAHYGRAIAIRPDYAEAHFNRAGIKSFHRDDADLDALEALANRDDLSANNQLYIHFALAKALEDRGDYVRAFEHLRKGNTLKRQQINYDEMAVLKMFGRISTVFDSRIFDHFQGEGDPSSTPVFVLGMPRSGSTLIEQILGSHPQIHGAGELTALDTAASSAFNACDHPLRYPECVPALDSVSLRQLGQAYLARLPALADGKVRIIDKMPGNFLSIGLIRLILPNARIIHTTRHPIDTCVSCYSQLFTSGLHFSYDLVELARYYRRYSELMTHWRCVLSPGTILDVSYEEVVDDLEGQARRLIDYCGLPWDDRCISFHRTRRTVKTASAVQVRKPLFRSSLQRWRRYEAGLAPLLHELGDILPVNSPHRID
jgi:tetratricopeptide (TPR) repeat protein